MPLDFKELSLYKNEYRNLDEYILQFIEGLQIIRNNSFKLQWEGKMKIVEKQKNMKQGYTFKIGELVGRKNNAATKNKRSLGANGKWIGPYEIIEVFDNKVSYRIQRVDDLKESIAINGAQLARWNSILEKDIRKTESK